MIVYTMQMFAGTGAALKSTGVAAVCAGIVSPPARPVPC